MSDLVVVDIQPEYEDYFNFDIYTFTDFINQSDYNNIHFFYNGYDTLGMVNEQDYKMWWFQNQLNESVIQNSNFYDKGYAFFRYCLDSGVDQEDTVELVRFMWKNDITDSRDIPEELWEKLDNQYVRELLEHTGDMIYIPDVMDYINNKVRSNPDMAGGGVDECLKEVEVAFLALGKSYNILHEWTY